MDGGPDVRPATRLAAEFPAVAAWPREDLIELIEGDHATSSALLDAAVHTVPSIEASDSEHLALLERVEQAAARNEARRADLEALRNDTRSAFEHARTLEAQWPLVERTLHEAQKVRLYVLTQRFTPFAIQTRLQMAANQLHDESEDLANAFVEGLSHDDVRLHTLTQDTAFVRQYRDMRTRHHLRRMLHEQCAQRRVQWRT